MTRARAGRAAYGYKQAAGLFASRLRLMTLLFAIRILLFARKCRGDARRGQKAQFLIIARPADPQHRPV